MKADLYPIAGPWSGRLFVVARPRGGDWLEDEANAWKTAGIDLVVSLLEDDEAEQLGLADEPQTADKQGIRFISCPIPDRGVPASTEAAIEAFGRIAAELRAGRNVAVHCRQGIGRSGLVAAGVLVYSGIQTQEAIEIVSSARGVSVPETREQLQWIEGLVSEVPVINSKEVR